MLAFTILAAPGWALLLGFVGTSALALILVLLVTLAIHRAKRLCARRDALWARRSMRSNRGGRRLVSPG